MRTNLRLEDLGGFLDEPLLAVMGTIRADGSAHLSPVCHERRDGGFTVWLGLKSFNTGHLRRDPRVSIVVAESVPPLRGVAVRGEAKFVDDDPTETARRIVTRYLGEEQAAAYAETLLLSLMNA